MSEPIRVSIIDYLNALPLNIAFKRGEFLAGLQLHYDFPSQCADNLAAGTVDAGLISSIEYQRIPQLTIASDICIASRRRVRSVVIVTKKPFEEIQTLAVDRFSRSSTALSQVLFHRKLGRQPRRITMAPELETMMQQADAALVIGDAALRQENHNYFTLDLATLWYEETGLPFVFAFWGLRGRAVRAGFADTLRQVKAAGRSWIQSHWREVAATYQMDPADLEGYLTENIHYDLQEKERASLDRFFRYSQEAGLIAEVRPLNFA